MKQKKIPLLFLIFCIALAIPVGAIKVKLPQEENRKAITLSHNGNLTFYKDVDFQKAIDDAQTNDTVFLAEGVYPGVSIGKEIIVIGSGAKSRILGRVNLNPTDTVLNLVLDGLRIESGLHTTAPVEGLWLRMCDIDSVLLDDSPSRNILIERCHTKRFLYTGVEEMKVYNSYLQCIKSNMGFLNDKKFINCYLYNHGTSNYMVGTFINSILDNIGYSYNIDSDITIVKYSVIPYSYSDRHGVHTSSENYWMVDDNLSNYWDDPDYIREKGYIGNDATVIGPYGGMYPYNLNPSVPAIVSSKIEPDPENQEFKINITISEIPQGTPSEISTN